MIKLEGMSGGELSDLVSEIRAEQQRRYERESAPQQITAAIESALAAGVPRTAVDAAIRGALTDDVEDGAEDPPSGAE